MYWTRLIEVDSFGTSSSIIAVRHEIVDDDHEYRWPLGPDIVEECRTVAAMLVVDPDSWAPLFDPQDFTEVHGPLEIESFRLPSEDLKTWADRVIRLRSSIVQRAIVISQAQEHP